MEPLSRRAALQVGGVGIASSAVGGIGLLLGSWSSSSFGTGSGTALHEPPVLRSAGGRLSVNLEAREGPVRIGGRDGTALSYNGGLPGPTLHLQLGDWLHVRLITSRQAVVNVPAHSSVKVLIAFETFTGHTVYRCHILDHEDLGTMGVPRASARRCILTDDQISRMASQFIRHGRTRDADPHSLPFPVPNEKDLALVDTTWGRDPASSTFPRRADRWRARAGQALSIRAPL